MKQRPFCLGLNVLTPTPLVPNLGVKYVFAVFNNRVIATVDASCSFPKNVFQIMQNISAHIVINNNTTITLLQIAQVIQ